MQEFLRENGQIITIVIVIAVLVALVVSVGPNVSKSIKASFKDVTDYGENIITPTINPQNIVNG